MVVSAFPDAGRGPVRGRGEVADVVGLRPCDVPVPDAPVGVVRDAPPADGLPPAVVLAAGAVDAVHAHVVVLGVAAPVRVRSAAILQRWQERNVNFVKQQLPDLACCC